MSTNRTISESKDDLKAAADQVTTNGFRTTFLVEPTEIEKKELSLFSVLDGIEDSSIQEIDPDESEYDVRYDFDIVMALKPDCLESVVIATRNAWMAKLVANNKASSYRPFRIESMRHYRGHWGNIECWIVRMTLSRYVCEDFSA